jgi:cobaltochelatase CobN
MQTIGLYTATENELGAVQRAGEQLEAIDLVVRSKGDLDDGPAIDAFIDEIADATAVVFWLHGSEESMPGYDHATERLREEGIPLVVKSTSDAFALDDTTVADGDRETAYAFLDCGGAINLANLCRFLGATYGDGDLDGNGERSVEYDDPVNLPTEGVYHPDHPGIEYDELRATFDSEQPTIGLWFYESHWTHENTRYVDALIRKIEAQGANALPVFCNPVTETDEQEDAEWTARNWFSDTSGACVDAVLSAFMFSLSMSERGRSADDEGRDAEEVFLSKLGVPVLQIITTMRSRSRYESSDTGVMGFELSLSVALPEFDGNVITHPISGKERMDDDADIGSAPKQHFPIDDRIDHAVRLAVNWARLRHLPNDEKKVAVVLHNYPPSDDGIGTAFGLDSPESAVNVLETLSERGYALDTSDMPALPTGGQELVETLTAQLTLDDRWVAPEDVREKSVDVVSTDQYREWFTDTDERFQEHVIEEWGEPPDRPFAIPGVEFGNVLVTVQPPRGFGMDPSKVYHDSDLQPPHDYVAFYGWLRQTFAADAVVHLGTHGSLEWLPGKTVGLNGESAPDQLVSDLPNVYPYIINNPGEGTQAKRRSYAAIVDYLTPVMRNAGSYGNLAELEELANQYREAGLREARTDDGEQLERLIHETVRELDLGNELGVDNGDNIDENTDELVERIHEYVTDIKTTQIRMGLHTLSEPPTGDQLVEYLVALTRLENPGAPSLRESVAGVLGVDYGRMLDKSGTYDEDLGMTYAEAADEVYETCVELVETLAQHDFDLPASEREMGPDDRVNMNLLVVDIDTLGETRAKRASHDALREILQFICEEAAPRVRAASEEIPQIADALRGVYVEPGGSGAPTRGGVDLLPTGRNFYTLDPRKVPAKSAWRVGKEVAEGVAERHYDEHDEYPEEIGVVAWGTPTVRTRGETVAQVLALMGVEPEWTDAGRVDDVRAISLDDLGRPRIDVTTRVSGLFRDAFPQAASVIHDAVERVVDLDEPHEMNYVKKHVEREKENLQTDEGIEESDAERAATHRVFTTRPGGYGAGTNKAVDEGNWEDGADLAEVYVQWGGYAMGKRGSVSEAHDAFERRLGNIDATVKIEDTAEQDEFDSSDWYAFHGGFINAVTETAGEEPASYVGDSSNPDSIDIYTNEEKVRKAMRARVLNPDWLDSMEEHDYKGAGDLSSTVDVVLGWDATTGVISDTLWSDVAEAYAFDDERREWMRDVNPWAVESITDTLLEAIERDLWGADDETTDQLRDINLAADADLEARASESEVRVTGDDD